MRRASLQVGLITAVTYLTVAHTLPALFCLRLLRKKQHWLHTALQVTAGTGPSLWRAPESV